MEALGLSKAKICGVKFGTLNIGFILKIKKRFYFLKTHLIAKNLLLLKKEALILKAIYGPKILLKTYTEKKYKTNRFWVLLKYLNKKKLSPQQILSEIKNLPFKKIGNKLKDSSLLTFFGKRAMCAAKNFYKKKLVSKNSYFRSKDLVGKMLKDLSMEPVSPCHGDLGPRNIMGTKKRNYFIDWEDAFMGIKGYDYLYWLSFLENQKHLTKNNLKNANIKINVAVGILLIIILIKCEISHQNNSYLNNSLSFDNRIKKVLRLL